LVTSLNESLSVFKQCSWASGRTHFHLSSTIDGPLPCASGFVCAFWLPTSRGNNPLALLIVAISVPVLASLGVPLSHFPPSLLNVWQSEWRTVMLTSGALWTWLILVADTSAVRHYTWKEKKKNGCGDTRKVWWYRVWSYHCPIFLCPTYTLYSFNSCLELKITTKKGNRVSSEYIWYRIKKSTTQRLEN
jgi:hypothetical protein